MNTEIKPAIKNLIDWLSQYEGKMISADQVILQAELLIKKEWDEVCKAYKEFLENKIK